MLTAIPYDASYHNARTVAATGGCSWHGRTCSEPPVISFTDRSGDRQSGCQRALRELVGSGELTDPGL